MVTPANVTPERGRLSINLPRPLWIAVAAIVLLVMAAGLRLGVPLYRRHLAIRAIDRAGGIIFTRRTAPELLRRWLSVDQIMRFDEVERMVNLLPRTNDAALVDVGWLDSLKELSLDDTQVTDDGLEHLKGLTNVWELSLKRTRITDAGLAHLNRLTHLESLFLNGTDVTDGGVAELQRALPRLKIRR